MFMFKKKAFSLIEVLLVLGVMLAVVLVFSLWNKVSNEQTAKKISEDMQYSKSDFESLFLSVPYSKGQDINENNSYLKSNFPLIMENNWGFRVFKINGSMTAEISAQKNNDISYFIYVIKGDIDENICSKLVSVNINNFDFITMQTNDGIKAYSKDGDESFAYGGFDKTKKYNVKDMMNDCQALKNSKSGEYYTGSIMFGNERK